MATSKARALAFWKKYGFFITMGIILLAGFLLYNLPRASQRTVSDALSPTIGGSEAGLLLGYYSAILLLLAQFYTVVKRSGYIPLSRKLGGAGLWLNIHIVMSIVALAAGLLHSGFPFRFHGGDLFRHGYAVLTTYVLIIVVGSGVFGRYLYVRLPAMKTVFKWWKQTHWVGTVALLIVGVAHTLVA